MITTSRYADSSIRHFAQALARAAHAPYCARGKKTIDQLVALARKGGFNRLLVLEEKGDHAHELAFIAIDELGRWNWLKRIGVVYDA